MKHTVCECVSVLCLCCCGFIRQRNHPLSIRGDDIHSLTSVSDGAITPNTVCTSLWVWVCLLTCKWCKSTNIIFICESFSESHDLHPCESHGWVMGENPGANCGHCLTLGGLSVGFLNRTLESACFLFTANLSNLLTLPWNWMARRNP